MAQTKRAKTQTEQKTITLTQEQFEELKSIVWENKIEELEEIGTGGEDDMKAIGFTLGSIHASLKSQFDRLEEILDQIDPQPGFSKYFPEGDDDDI